ncbi:protein kinase [Lujinxingia vulgaris]|uniref:non-specific serine/threonine protein kinase n=1 Tax=Lujinxingia vulgaris TaxID=2600176 RepID=A0A5C6XLC7_9DELT|nr:serine/threonine-protein kinase [Lujinxingia vulgaris]TXD39015.1 protein kinase [Lujinxingia vulgaris]
MRICPKCNRRFPDNTLFCPDDGKALVHRVDNPTPADSAPPASAPMRNPHPTGQQHSGQQPGRAPTRTNPPAAARRDTSPPLDPNNLVGQSLFGEYTITRKLGEGGMGAVYLAQQNSIDQKIAVKVLHEHSAESEELIQRFHREARVVSMLTHPNIIRVFIFGRTDGGLLYLAMEYVEGQSLRDRMGSQPMEEIQAIKLMKQLCSGLSEAHDLGIIHRDLKPDNVLLTNFRGESNFVKILDFGIAKINEVEGGPEQQKLTQAGIVYGTPEYLSPEQAQALELDHRTDLYSLGVMLFELLTGKVPFTGTTPVQILTAHVFNEVPKPSSVAPGPIAPTMERIILKALSKDPADRFEDAMAMFEALVAREQEIIRERGLSGRAAYVPGMELTGMYRAIDLSQEQPGLPPAASVEEVESAPTLAMAAPVTGAPAAGAAAAAAAQPSQPAKSNDSTRTIITVVIGLASFIFLVLVAIIGYLLTR